MLVLSTSLALADTSASITGLTPGDTVRAKSLITFKVSTTGFLAQAYQVTDSFAGSSVSNTHFDNAGNFSWVPVASDAGVHTLTITARNYSGDSATITKTITVQPPPSVRIESMSPGEQIMPGTTLNFRVVPDGFTDPKYIIGDSFSGSSVTISNLDTAGNFTWTPNLSQNGDHSITVYVSDSQGRSAQVSQNVRVGAGPSLAVTNLQPGDTVKPGTQVTFTLAPINYRPSSFALMDSFSGSTAGNGNLNMNGTFAWSPATSDVGYHELTITGTVGFYGESASIKQKVTVLNPDGTMPANVPAPAVAGASTALTTTAAAQPSTTSTTSTGAVVAGSEVDALLKQLATLQAQMASLSSSSGGSTAASAPTPAPSTVTFVSYLRPGSEGDEVLALQNVLKAQGYFDHEPTGYYGDLTVDAVVSFQQAKGLDALGVVGPATRLALNALSSSPAVLGASTSASSDSSYVFTSFLELGDRGDEVVQLQKKLSRLGFFSEEATGYFGSITEEAVKAFQIAHEIDARGWVGPATRAALNQ